MSDMRLVERYALPAAATVSLVSSVGLAIADRTASATLLAGLFVVTVLFINFPSLESVKAWGIEAKLIRNTLDEAKASLDQFRKLVALSSTQTFWALSKQGRLHNDDDILEANRLAIATTMLMREAGVDSTTIRDAQSSYIRMMDIDFGGLLRLVMSSVVMKDRVIIAAQISDLNRRSTFGKEDVRDQLDQAGAQIRHIDNLLGLVVGARSDLDGTAALLRDAAFRDGIDAHDATCLDPIYSQMSELLSASVNVGYLTKDAEAFLRTYSSTAENGAQKLIDRFKVPGDGQRENLVLSGP